MVSRKELIGSLKKCGVYTDEACTKSVFSGRESEHEEYLDTSGNRIIHTFDSIQAAVAQKQPSTILEIGPGPYFLTSLLSRFLNCNVVGLGRPPEIWPGSQILQSITKQIVYIKSGDTISPFDELFCNAEKDLFPFPDNHFDVVVATEVFEHLIFSPTHFLFEIHRVLKPGGIMVLTTPNAVSLTKTIKMLLGKSVWDYYSGYGVYGRHQREYTLTEIKALLSAVNFGIRTAYTTHYPNMRQGLSDRIKQSAFAILPSRKSQLFVIGTKQGKARAAYPSFLYKSIYPEIWKKHGVVILE
jgi:SAM-dependent methyltransferase